MPSRTRFFRKERESNYEKETREISRGEIRGKCESKILSRDIAENYVTLLSPLITRDSADSEEVEGNEKCLLDSWCSKAMYQLRRQSLPGRNYKRNVS